MARIGLGLLTYKRPDYFKQSLEAAIKANPDYLVVYNDGSPKEEYEEIYQKNKKVEIIHPEENKGVSKAKNALLKRLLELNCTHLFLIEDDILITSPRVFDRYIAVGNKYGFHHLNFAHHGPANKDGPQSFDGIIEYYPHCVGAFSYYTRECIEEVGFFDENFQNCWEHVEHTKRIGDAGLTAPFGAFPDISGSKELLQEIPNSIEGSIIRPSKEWRDKMEKGLAYWRSKDPSCPVEML